MRALVAIEIAPWLRSDIIEERLADVPLRRRAHQIQMYTEISRDQLAALETHHDEIVGVDVVAMTGQDVAPDDWNVNTIRVVDEGRYPIAGRIEDPELRMMLGSESGDAIRGERRTGVESDPAEPQQCGPQQDHRHVVRHVVVAAAAAIRPRDVQAGPQLECGDECGDES